MNCLIIGNPESQRTVLFQKAFDSNANNRSKVICHIDLLQGFIALKDFLKPGILIRIESPGEDFFVEQELIKLGAKITGHPVFPYVDNIKFDKGRILFPLLWYKGWQYYLQLISKTVKLFNSGFSVKNIVRFMNNPEDIILMYDKAETHRLLTEKGIRTAPALTKISCYDHLISEMSDNRIFRVFIKLRYSSSASGIMAFEFSRLNRVSTKTTVELSEVNGVPHLYNSLKVRHYTSKQKIKQIIDLLCPEHVHVEKWIPKSCVNRKHYDARFVVIGQKARHRIARLSFGPITNLHLGNERKEIDKSWIEPDIIQAMEKTAEDSATIFPDSFYSGVDLLLPMNGKKPVVLEINAFGDFLNNVHYDNMGIYQYEVSLLRNGLVDKIT